EISFDFLQRFGDSSFLDKNNPVHFLNPGDLLIGIAPSFQPNRVDTAITNRFPRRFGKRRDIFTNQRAATNIYMRSDSGKLLYSAGSAKNGVIIDEHMPRELHRVSDNA